MGKIFRIFALLLALFNTKIFASLEVMYMQKVEYCQNFWQFSSKLHILLIINLAAPQPLPASQSHRLRQQKRHRCYIIEFVTLMPLMLPQLLPQGGSAEAVPSWKILHLLNNMWKWNLWWKPILNNDQQCCCNSSH